MATVFGNTYKVNITQPIGSTSDFAPDIVYEVNYGMVEGAFDVFDDPQEAYVLTDNKDIKSFTGKLIAIIHRINDVKNIWVISDKSYTKEEILERVNFMEQFFKVEVII